MAALLIRNIAHLAGVREQPELLRGKQLAKLPGIDQAYLIIDGETIAAYGTMKEFAFRDADFNEVYDAAGRTVLPAWCDSHTHTVFAASREGEFVDKIKGLTYAEIAARGGGILHSARKLETTSESELYRLARGRVEELRKLGTGAIEIKSGYGLDLDNELKMLRVIGRVQQFFQSKARIVPTCLAAHIKPKDFEGSQEAYLAWITAELLPQIRTEQLSQRVDIFVEQSAFGLAESRQFLQKAKALGFDLTVHADQFTAGSSTLAVEMGALSADHLEASTEKEIYALAQSDTVAVVLPGASLGLGEPFAPARKLLDAGACVAIASDFNPGSAPMGDLLTQAAILATYQKLSTAEVLSGLTFRAAKALKLREVGRIETGYSADVQGYACADYREILYQQGRLKPYGVW